METVEGSCSEAELDRLQGKLLLVGSTQHHTEADTIRRS
jgi:hypothetical protein